MILPKQSFLKHLELATEDKVELVIERDSLKHRINVPIERLIVNKSNRPWVSYHIDKENSLGIFTLDKCIYNHQYIEAVESFLKDIARFNISNIIVDVRANFGGDSRVFEEFIRYFDVDEYKSYGMEIRYSRHVKEQRGYYEVSEINSYPHSIVKNSKINNSEVLFNGDLYILTSAATFSSATAFAVMIQDNNLGKVVGEPSGNKPSNYGDVLFFNTPKTNLRFIVSYKKFFRPDMTKHEDDYLNPDITVYTTIEDILENKDAQLEALIQVIRNKEMNNK